MKAHLMTLHAITGCDTTSALFREEKNQAFLFAEENSLDMIDSFESSISSKEDMQMLENDSF